MSRDSFFTAAEHLVEQISSMLEERNSRESVKTDNGMFFQKLLEELDSCQQTNGIRQVLKALEILLNYTCLLPSATIISDKERSCLLVELDGGDKYQIIVTQTEENF